MRNMLEIFSTKEVMNFKSREKRNFLHYAIDCGNVDALSVLLSFYDTSNFYERAMDGSYAELAALRSKDTGIKSLIS